MYKNQLHIHAVVKIEKNDFKISFKISKHKNRSKYNEKM